MTEPLAVEANSIPRIGQPGGRLAMAQYMVIAFLFWVALYLYVPTLPTYVASRSTSLALVGLVLSMYGLCQTLVRVPLGIAADWAGRRKPFIIGGLALAGLGAWTMGMADSVYGLMLGRAITGLAVGTWVLLVVAFSDLFRHEDTVRASTALTLACSFGCFVASMATGPLNEWGGYQLAFMLAAVAAGVAVLVAVATKENRRPTHRPRSKDITGLLVLSGLLIPSLFNALLHYAVYVTSFGFLPILAKQMGASDLTLSILMTVYLAMSTLGALFATVLARRGHDWRRVHLSVLFLLLGIGGMAIARSVLLLGLAQACMGLSFGTGYSVLMGLSIQHVADATRTTAMAIHQAICGAGMFAGSWIGGIMAERIGIQPMFVVTGIVCLVGALLLNLWLKRSGQKVAARQGTNGYRPWQP